MRTINSNNRGDVVIAASSDWSGEVFVYWAPPGEKVRAAGGRLPAVDLLAGRYHERHEIPPDVFARAVAIAVRAYVSAAIKAAADAIDIVDIDDLARR